MHFASIRILLLNENRFYNFLLTSYIRQGLIIFRVDVPNGTRFLTQPYPDRTPRRRRAFKHGELDRRVLTLSTGPVSVALIAELRAEGLPQAQVPSRRVSAGTWGPSMERKEMKDREERAGLDSPERAVAPVTDDANSGGAEKGAGPDPETPSRPDLPWARAAESPRLMSGAPGPVDAPDERVLGSPWWEGGSRPEEEAEEEPDTYRGAEYIYRGVRYGEPKSQPPEEPDDDDPVNMSVLAVMSEDQPAVPPAEGQEPGEPGVESSWWEGGSRPEETAEEETDAGVGEAAPGAPRTYSGAAYTYRGVRYGESVPEPESQPPEEPDDDDPVDMSVLAVMSEDQPAVPPAEGAGAGRTRRRVFLVGRRFEARGDGRGGDRCRSRRGSPGRALSVQRDGIRRVHPRARVPAAGRAGRRR